jgi:hypothetical protein
VPHARGRVEHHGLTGTHHGGYGWGAAHADSESICC